MTEIAYGSYLARPDASRSPRTPSSWALETKAKMVDLKFTDLLGTWQHVTLPLRALDEDAFDGGPRLRRLVDPRLAGHRGVGHAADARSGDRDRSTRSPRSRPSRSLCEILDPITREPYERDPRLIAQRAEALPALETGIADTIYFGPEAEFFVFDSSPTTLDANRAALRGRLERGPLELAPAGRRLHDPREGRATSRSRRTTRCTTCAPRWCCTLERLGIACEFHHHEVATAGQCEIDMRFTTLTRMADQVMTLQVRRPERRAKRAGKTATFMPKPIFGDNGSGMHCHQSLWKDGETLMADDAGYAGLSRDSPAATSAACSRTRRRCSRSARRRRTRTAGSCPATRRP